MNPRALFISALVILASAAAQAKEFKIYATFIEDTRVELSDGAVWMMDKGDVFPIVAYKNMQKNVILQLAGATFMTETARTRVLKPEEVAAGVEAYRNNVRAYLESTSKKMTEKLVGPDAKKDAKAEPPSEPKPEDKGEAKPEPKPDPAAPEKKE